LLKTIVTLKTTRVNVPAGSRLAGWATLGNAFSIQALVRQRESADAKIVAVQESYTDGEE